MAEVTLSKHYGVTGTLGAAIDKARELLPRSANQYLLGHLNKLANSILHTEADELATKFLNTNEEKLEREVRRILEALRALIEAAPHTGRA